MTVGHKKKRNGVSYIFIIVDQLLLPTKIETIHFLIVFEKLIVSVFSVSNKGIWIILI